MDTPVQLKEFLQVILSDADRNIDMNKDMNKDMDIGMTEISEREYTVILEYNTRV